MTVRGTRAGFRRPDCAHEQRPGINRCRLCKAARIIRRLFDGHDRFKALEGRFIDQIAAGRYTYNSLRRGDPTCRAIELLLAYGELPNAAWVDALPVPARTRETFRSELIAVRYLAAPIGSAPLAQKLVIGRCAHSSSACLPCREKRRIEALLRPHVHLHVLRDLYLRRLDAEDGKPRFFCTRGNKLASLIRDLGRDPGLINHAWLDTRHVHLRHHVAALRRDLVDCGLLDERAASDVCSHVAAGRHQVRAFCTFCSAKRAIARLLDEHADLAPLKARLMEQVDRGLYNRHVLQGGGQIGKGLREICARKETLSHAVVDRLAIRPCDREVIRAELVVAGLLERREPAAERRLLRPRATTVACAHRTTSCCGACGVERLIDVAFQDYPLLRPLRDRYVAQFRSGFYPRNYFRRGENPMWRYIRELGDSGESPTHGYLDSQRPSVALRALREELMACGLIKRVDEHPGVRHFEIWARRFIASSELDPETRRIVDRYRQLSMMAYARQYLNRRTDHGYSVRDRLHFDLRLIVGFVQRLKSNDRKLGNFEEADARELSDATLSKLRPFLIWLRRNGISSTRWIPKSLESNVVFRGVGTVALRRSTDRFLNDSSVPLRFRVLAILSYFGIPFTSLSPLRASDVLSTDEIRVDRRQYDLEPTVASMVRRLRDELMLEVRDSRPEGWDPWLFAPADALEQPDPMPLSRSLLSYGFKSRRLRNESTRLGAANATLCLVTQTALGRETRTASTHLKAFSGRAGSYAAMLATERLSPDHEI